MLVIIVMAAAFLPAAGDIAYAAINYTTESFDVDVVLSEDNVYHVTERITVDFNSPGHGIFRYIGYGGEIVLNRGAQEYHGKGNNKMRNIKVEGYKYKTDDARYNDEIHKTLQIGDSNTSVTGLQEYVIEYDYVCHADNTKD